MGMGGGGDRDKDKDKRGLEEERTVRIRYNWMTVVSFAF